MEIWLFIFECHKLAMRWIHKRKYSYESVWKPYKNLFCYVWQREATLFGVISKSKNFSKCLFMILKLFFSNIILFFSEILSKKDKL